MSKRVEMIGRRFGRLVVVALSEKRGNRGQLKFDCVCDCGGRTTVMGEDLRRNKVVSCGCYQKERAKRVNMTHGGCCSGQSKRGYDKLYHTWQGMKDRCFNPSSTEYEKYGGRGITVCDEWKDNYITFRDFMLSIGFDPAKPTKEQTIDRIDVNGNYCPENCRLLSLSEQQYNKTNNRLITYNGVTKTATEWAKEFGIKMEMILKRIDESDWSVEEALTRPKRATEKFTVDGETHTVREWAEVLKMPWSTLRGKIKPDKQRLLEKEVRDRRRKGLC